MRELGDEGKNAKVKRQKAKVKKNTNNLTC